VTCVFVGIECFRILLVPFLIAFLELLHMIGISIRNMLTDSASSIMPGKSSSVILICGYAFASAKENAPTPEPTSQIVDT
jgi:hypothetical protein